MSEIVEGNKLIAEYMDIPKCKRCADCGAYQYGAAIIFYPAEMEYHKKWDWLMPVLFKVLGENGSDFTMADPKMLAYKDIGYSVYLFSDHKNGIMVSDLDPLMAVWKGVVEYIESKKDGR